VHFYNKYQKVAQCFICWILLWNFTVLAIGHLRGTTWFSSYDWLSVFIHSFNARIMKMDFTMLTNLMRSRLLRHCNIYIYIYIYIVYVCVCVCVRSQWPQGQMRGSTAAHLLRPGFESHPWHGCFVCCVYCVLLGRGYCDELITRPEESYRLWRAVVCDKQTSCVEETIARAGLQCQRK
jgi:hypothetical protein